jgi:hypothetical protein
VRTVLLGFVAAIALSSASAHADSDQYNRGYQDGIAWRQWTGGLTGDMHAGAGFWAGERSNPNPGSCFQGTPDFQEGCRAAKARLTTPDILRKAQPDYKAGWNAAFADDVVIVPDATASAMVPGSVLSAPHPTFDQEEKVRQKELAARALEADNARRLAELQNREIAARAARAEADKATAEVAKRKAEQDALDARANAKLKYDEQLAAYVQKWKDKGYTPITFQDLVLDKKDLASWGTKIALHGFYKPIGKIEILFRSEDINDDERIVLLTENAERDTRKFFLVCRENAESCPVTVLGTVGKCASIDKYGAKSAELCFTVDDSWSVPERGTS